MTKDEFEQVKQKHLETVDQIADEFFPLMNDDRKALAVSKLKQIVEDGYASCARQWGTTKISETEAYNYVVGYARGRTE